MWLLPLHCCNLLQTVSVCSNARHIHISTDSQTTQSSCSLAEPQITSWLIHSCVTYREKVSNLNHISCLAVPPRSTETCYAVLKIYSGIKLPCCYIKRNLSVSVFCFVGGESQSRSAAWLNCPLKAERSWVIMQRRFSRKNEKCLFNFKGLMNFINS